MSSKNPREAERGDYIDKGRTLMPKVLSLAEKTHTVNHDIVVNGKLFRSTPIIIEYAKEMSHELYLAKQARDKANAQLGGLAAHNANLKRQNDLLRADAKEAIAAYRRVNGLVGFYRTLAFIGWAVVVMAAGVLAVSPETFFDLVGWHG